MTSGPFVKKDQYFKIDKLGDILPYRRREYFIDIFLRYPNGHARALFIRAHSIISQTFYSGSNFGLQW
jgi:hypothetical protein